MAEEVKKEVIIDVVLKTEDAITNIVEARKQIAALREENKRLAESEYDSEQAIAENNEAIKALNKVIASNSKEIQNNIQKQKQLDGSINQLRAELSNAQKAYDALSKTEREGAKGKEMLTHIQETTEQLRQAEFESGRFQRNVGNYPGLLGQVGGVMEKWANNITNVTGNTRSLRQGIFNAGQAVVALGKRMIELMKIPIVALIALIAAVLMKLKKELQKNDEALTTLQKSFSAIQPIITLLNKILGYVVTALAKIVEWTTKAANALLYLIPQFRDAASAAEQLVDAEDKLQDAEREYTVQHAKNEREIAKLREESADREHTTFEQRKANLQEAMKIEQIDLAQNKKNLEEKLRIEKEKQKQDNDYSDEAKDRIADLEAAVIQADTEYYRNLKKLQREYQSFLREERAEQERIRKEEEQKEKERKRKQAEDAKKWAETRKKQQSTERQLERESFDLTMSIMKDTQQKQEAVLREAYRRQIEDLQLKLKEDKTLTKKAKEDINYMIMQLQVKQEQDLAEIRKNYSEKEFERKKADAERKLQLAQEGTAEWLQQQKELLDMEEQQAVEAATKNGEDVQLVHQLYNQKRKTLDENAARDEYQRMRETAQLEMAELDNQLAHALYAAGENEVERLRVQKEYAEKRVEALKTEYDTISSLTEEDATLRYGSLDAWKQAMLDADNAIIAANEEVRESSNAISKSQQEQAKSIVSAFQQTGDTIQGLFDTLAETDERYSDFATAMAMANIMTSTAISIANAIQGATEAAAATGLGAPIATPVFIAEMVSIVMAGITSAISTLNKAKAAKEQAQFAEGGLVKGEGTSTSDSIPARLSNGEFVVNAAATRRNLPQLVAMNGGWGATAPGARRFAEGGWVSTEDVSRGWQVEQVRQAMAEAVSEIQPVVSVREITSVANRVSAKERLSKR